MAPNATMIVKEISIIFNTCYQRRMNLKFGDSKVKSPFHQTTSSFKVVTTGRLYSYFLRFYMPGTPFWAHELLEYLIFLSKLGS